MTTTQSNVDKRAPIASFYIHNAHWILLGYFVGMLVYGKLSPENTVTNLIGDSVIFFVLGGLAIAARKHNRADCARCDRLRDKGMDAALRHTRALRLFHRRPLLFAFPGAVFMFGALSRNIPVLNSICVCYYSAAAVAALLTALAIYVRTGVMHRAYGNWCPVCNRHRADAEPPAANQA